MLGIGMFFEADSFFGTDNAMMINLIRYGLSGAVLKQIVLQSISVSSGLQGVWDRWRDDTISIACRGRTICFTSVMFPEGVSCLT